MEKTSEIDPREAAKSCCSGSKKALKEYAQPKPTKVTANVPATTNQP
jgi:hypothetical protein